MSQSKGISKKNKKKKIKKFKTNKTPCYGIGEWIDITKGIEERIQK